MVICELYVMPQAADVEVWPVCTTDSAACAEFAVVLTVCLVLFVVLASFAVVVPMMVAYHQLRHNPPDGANPRYAFLFAHKSFGVRESPVAGGSSGDVRGFRVFHAGVP